MERSSQEFRDREGIGLIKNLENGKKCFNKNDKMGNTVQGKDEVGALGYLHIA